MIPVLGLDFMPGAGPFDLPGDYYLAVNGALGSNATTPDTGTLDILGDIEVRVDATLDSWTPAVGTGLEIFGKFTPPSNQSWLLWINANRRPVFRHSTDGTAIVDNICPVPLPVTFGRLALAAVLDVDNGAGGHTVSFYTAPTIAGPWTLLGAVINASGTTSIHNSTSNVGVGNVPGSGFNAAVGRIHAAQIIAGTAGTDVRAAPDFAGQAPGTPSFVDSEGLTWTVGATAAIAGFDWVPATDDLMSMSWNEGRTDDLTRFGPTAGTIVLRNEGRKYDPTYSAGPYFGLLNPRTPFRLRMSDDGGSTWADMYYGFCHGGFEQTYHQPSFATCTVELQDLLGVIAGTRLPPSTYAAAVLADKPKAYWTLDETTGVQMADSSGYGRHGRYDNSTLGEDPLIEGDGHSVLFPHVGDNRGEWSGQGLPVAAPCTLEGWIRTPRDPLAIKSIIVAQRDNTLGSALALQIHTAAAGSPDGELVIDFFGLGSGYKARGHTRCDDNRRHHVVCVISGAGTAPADVALYVDGVAQTKTTVSGTNPGPWAGHQLWTVGNTANNGQGDYGLDGLADEAAIYDFALSADQVVDHFEAGADAHDGDRVGQRIDRVLDLVGVPAAMRDIATGDTALGPAEYDGDTAGSYLDRIVESEQGYLWVDHRNGGKLTFKGRYSRLTDTRSTTSQATFTDTQPTPGGELPFEDIVPTPNGVDGIVNEVIVRWRGGTEHVTDAASVKAFGAQDRTITTEAPTPSAATSAGGWMVTRYGMPQSRVRQLDLDPGGHDVLWPACLDLRVGDRITAKWRPQGVGSQISQQLLVEGLRSELTEGLDWTRKLTLSDADDTLVWIWGTSTWGETTVWG